MKKGLIFSLVVLLLTVTISGCNESKTTNDNSQTQVAEKESSKKDDVSVKDNVNTKDTSNNEIKFPLSETYNVTGFAFSNTGNELDKTLFMSAMEEKTNIHWDLKIANQAELEEKRNLSFNSGNYYDVYIKSGISATDAYKYGSQGIIIPLNDLIDQYMPNLKEKLNEQDAWNNITSADGNIYALPQMDGDKLCAPAVFINKKWLDKVGAKVPTTKEEFMDVLKKFRDGDPNGNGKKDEYPIYCPAGAAEYTLPLFGVAMDYNTMSMYEDGKMIYVPTSQEYKEFLKFWAEAYKENLINKDCYSATWDDINAIGATSDTLGTIATYGVYQHVGTERANDYVAILPFNGKHTMPASKGVDYGGLCITDKCKHPEYICAWADYLYSEEGGILGRLGVEGKTYTINSDNKYVWNTGAGYGDDQNAIRNSQTLAGWYPAPLANSKFVVEGNSSEEEFYLGQLRAQLLQYAADEYPVLNYTEEELKEKSTLVTDIYSAYSQYQAEVITGQKNLEDTWDSYIEGLKKMGLDRLNEIDQNAYSRFKGNK